MCFVVCWFDCLLFLFVRWFVRLCIYSFVRLCVCLIVCSLGCVIGCSVDCFSLHLALCYLFGGVVASLCVYSFADSLVGSCIRPRVWLFVCSFVRLCLCVFVCLLACL